MDKSEFIMNESSKPFRFSNQWVVGVIVLQMLFNTLLYPCLLAVAPTFGQSLSMVAIVNFIDLPIVGFLFGLLMALIPFKGLKYRYRYLRVSLLFILVVQSVEMLGLILLAILKWGLKYPG